MARSAYDQIYHDLKNAIEDGTYSYQDMLPSQSVLVKKYQCAHNTVRKAIALLASQGFCLPIHGKGVRVIWKPRHKEEAYSLGYALGEIETFAKSAERSGVEVKTEVRVFEKVTADDDLSQLTGFPINTELLHVERIRLIDGKALIRDKSYYRASAVEGVTESQAESSIYAYVEGELGLKMATRKRTIFMSRATNTDRSWLEVEGCDYLAIIACHTFDSDAKLFEYTESHYHPEHFRFSDTIVRKPTEHHAQKQLKHS